MGDNAQRTSVCAAIDFGTTYCRLAYSYLHEKNKIYAISQWPDGNISTKVPTAVLFDKDQYLVAFGEEAVDSYCEIMDNEEADDYYYFYRFKMILYKEKVTN